MKNAACHAAAFVILLSASFCSAATKPLTFGGPTMGTRYRVVIANVPVGVEIPRLKRNVESLLAEVDQQMSTYRPDSELSRFNREETEDWYPVSAATATVVAAAQEISEKTQGALDVTVGPLVNLWHFGPRDRVHAAKSEATVSKAFGPPTDEAVAAAKAAVGYTKLDVRFDPPALRKRIDNLEVDLSSIAPGYAVDRMAAILVDHGIDNFMVEIGGEVRSSGRRADGKPWRVAIERPVAERREMLVALPLVDSAIATAGDYRKYYEIGGRRYSHIIDPATARPVDHSLASVTVVADTCMESDGWDTALVVLGPQRGYECAEKHGIAALFVSHAESGDNIQATSAWRERFGDVGTRD